MNEAERLFVQTEKERKRIGRGSRAKKIGSKSQFCGLPSDYLTRSEIKKLNGDVKVYNLNKPMKWGEFREMPHDLRTEYIKKLADMGASREDITNMFGVKPTTYSAFMAHHHNGERLLNGKNGVKNNDAFVLWYCNDGKKEEEEEPKMPDIPEPENKPKTDATGSSITLELKSCEVSFFGDPHAVFEKVLQLMNPSMNYEITVSFTAADKSL